MSVNEYKKALSTKLSAVKEKIIDRLWQSGNTFPKNWVKSTELLKITKQKYFDRRIRELRDATGCDIETSVIDGEHSYRLKSEKINISNPRDYLTGSQKKALFETANYTCAVCGKKFDEKAKGLQADHKIPLIRNGPRNETNWQPLCIECNVGKRRACAGCKIDCNICSWAFPENIQAKTLIQISPDLNKYLYEQCKTNNKTPSVFIAEALEKYRTKDK